MVNKLFASIGIMAAVAVAASCSQGAPGSDADKKLEAAVGVIEDANRGVMVGEAGPAWQNLMGTDDQSHSLSDLADAKLVAVVFTCNHCPVAVAYEDRLIELTDSFKDRGVQVVAINVNNLEADKLPAIKERAADKGFNFLYLYDPSQQIGRQYGATVTPHAFVLDQNRHVAYIGAIDDNMNPDQVTKHYLRDALEALLAGQPADPAVTDQFGCGIKYE